MTIRESNSSREIKDYPGHRFILSIKKNTRNCFVLAVFNPTVPDDTSWTPTFDVERENSPSWENHMSIIGGYDARIKIYLINIY